MDMNSKKNVFWKYMEKVRKSFSDANYQKCLIIIDECKKYCDLTIKGRLKLLQQIENLALRVKTENNHEDSKTVQFSFVTSVFNRFWQLKETLPNNLKYLRRHSDCELIIVDFGGSDSEEILDYINTNFTFDILKGTLKYYKKDINWNSFHMAQAKNAAARLSLGSVIVSLDADNYITNDDINLFRTLISDDLVILHQTTGPAPLYHSDWQRYSLFEKDKYHSEKLTWDGSSGRIACSRKLFEMVNGYNENFVGMGMDDIDFLIRSILSGGEYKHSEIDRPWETVFIDNGSANEGHEHSENQLNWDIMDAQIDSGEYKVKYNSSVPCSAFSQIEPECVLNSLSAEVTLFSSVFNAETYIQRFQSDVNDILTSTSNVSLWLLDIVGSHPNEVSKQLKNIAEKNPNVFYIPIHSDPGLYSCWNIAIKKIHSQYIGNLNVDDLRGKGWLDSCLKSLRANMCDVSSPVTIPFRNPDINCYDEFYNSSIMEEGFDKWFDKLVKYRFSDKTIHYEALPRGYYRHFDMVQTLGDRKLASYCIPNASSLWRHEIHETAGYFDEITYGAYTDLAFWMKASHLGYVFKQNSYPVLFYLSNEQAHKRQDHNYNVLLDLVAEYGGDDYKLLAAANRLDLSLIGGSYGNHHLLGWNWVRDNIEKNFVHNPHGILLDLFVERTFFWNNNDENRVYKYDKAWIGFIHTTPHNNTAFDKEAQNLDCLLREDRFLSSLKLCKALFVLSQDNATYLENKLNQLGFSTPVFTTFHPNIPISSNGANNNPSGKIYHIGWHLRSFSDFARLDFPKERKILLMPGSLDKEYFINEVVNKELSSNGLSNIEKYVSKIYTADDDEYQNIMHSDIIFNSYIQPAGSNLISECISAGAYLVINRHPGFEDYLGDNYPLFYDDLDDAKNLIKKLIQDKLFQTAVRGHHKIKHDELSIDSFVFDFLKIIECYIA